MPIKIRSYAEFTAKNSLRPTLVLGVKLEGLLCITFGVSLIQILLRDSRFGSFLTIAFALIGYASLRVFEIILKPGAIERTFFRLEKLVNPMLKSNYQFKEPTQLPSKEVVFPPDLLSEDEIILESNKFYSEIVSLSENESRLFRFKVSKEGAVLLKSNPETPNGALLVSTLQGISQNKQSVYTLIKIPVQTHPLWIYDKLNSIYKFTQNFEVWVSIRGVSQESLKKKLERSQRNSFQGITQLSSIARNLDSSTTHAECESLIEGLSRGDERIVEISLLIIANKNPDIEYFLQEKDPVLPIFSSLGFKKKFYQAHYMRAVCAADLIPQFFDPFELPPASLQSRRNFPVYFNPNDKRLDALHWLVVGATGSGKSFFVGTLLKRLIIDTNGINASVLFVDHHRSFKKFITGTESPYFEPAELKEVEKNIHSALKHLSQSGKVSGIELSELLLHQKKQATHVILSAIEQFLKTRESNHTLYVVLDECWNFMRDEPLMVQRAFREFRKLKGAAIAITQSLSDFLKDEAGQAILQNAPIRIILRQGEDVSRYQEALLLNSVEIQSVRYLQKNSGEFSECIIKTPYFSRLARLYPTQDEHELFRTDSQVSPKESAQYV